VAPIIIRARIGVGAAVLVCLLCGCGLSEYEAEMEKQQKRIDYMEEENAVLEADYFRMPPKKEGTKILIPANHFFFRPPKGFSADPAPTSVADLYEFNPTSKNSGITKLWAGIYIVKAEKDKKAEKSDKFQNDVLSFLHITSKEGKKVDVMAGNRNKRPTFELYEEKGPKEVTRAYFYKDDPPSNYRIVIAMRMQAGVATDNNAKHIIDTALATTRAGKEAYVMTRTYKPVGGTKAPGATPGGGKGAPGGGKGITPKPT
jgi:hypothetical protein